ncbi:hypothetical protein DKX38_000162 [Salix brachista]|uniref:F-box domain-containing protein n=1 Tax=Salix brachista TaxID=2182728 RepID=A0A5N5P1I4_9ROSI|nr:hypothetical protein DKX38_000162 [Salix brachista]
MKKSSSQQSQNQHFPLRRSARLADKFLSVPDELTTKIFSKLEDDPKTLIRCSAVSKKWASFVSKTVNLTLRFSRTGESLPCSKRHHHVPLLAIPSIMKVGTGGDLEKVEKWLTACEEESWLEEYNRDDNRYNAGRGAHLTLKNAESNAEVKGLDVDAARASISTHNSVVPEPPSHAKYRASDSRTEDCPHLCKSTFSTIQGFPVTYFYWRMLDHRPKTLRRMVIMSSKMEGFRSGGKVFMRYEQLPNLRDSVSNYRVNERWLEDPQNVVHWHKNHSDKEHKLQEQVWLLYEWHFFVTNREPDMKEMIVKETDYTELLDGLDYDDDGGDHIRKHRSI